MTPLVLRLGGQGRDDRATPVTRHGHSCPRPRNPPTPGPWSGPCRSKYELPRVPSWVRSRDASGSLIDSGAESETAHLSCLSKWTSHAPSSELFPAGRVVSCRLRLPSFWWTARRFRRREVNRSLRRRRGPPSLQWSLEVRRGLVWSPHFTSEHPRDPNTFPKVHKNKPLVFGRPHWAAGSRHTGGDGSTRHRPTLKLGPGLDQFGTLGTLTTLVRVSGDLSCRSRSSLRRPWVTRTPNQGPEGPGVRRGRDRLLRSTDTV